MTPEKLVAQAASLGLEVLAITDHDTTEGVAEARAAGRSRGIKVVPGVEISAISGREELHLLGYFVGLRYPELQMILARSREARQERARKMLDRLASLGMPIEWETLVQISGGSPSVGRPHIAAALLKAGYVSSYDEAFSLWIGRGGPAYVERYKLTPEEAIQLVRRSGGLPVLSHPYIFSRSGETKVSLDLKRWLPRLREAGLVGIEVYYPNYTRRVSRDLLALAVQHGLLPTGGSDFHGGVMGNGMGSVDVPWAVWEGLYRRHRQSRAGSTGPRSSNSQPEESLIPEQVTV
jgi:hypothetical protein